MNRIDLSLSEIYVLSLIYESGEADVHQILEKTATKEWKYTTVLTLVNRLLNKGHVDRKKQGKRYIYSPKDSRNDSFRLIMDRLFGTTLLNDPKPMIEYLCLSKKLNGNQKMMVKELLAGK